MGVTPGRVSQIERGELATIDAVARYVQALGGRLDLIASFGDHTLTVTTTEAALTIPSEGPLRFRSILPAHGWVAFPATGLALTAGPIARSKTGEHNPPSRSQCPP